MLLCRPWLACLLCGIRRSVVDDGVEQFLWFQAEPLNPGGDPRPFFGKKFLALAREQKVPRAGFDEHAEASLFLDQFLVGELLVGLQHRQGIDPKLGRDIAHGRQRITFFEHAVEYHVHALIAKLAVDWLTVVPLMIHPVSR